MYNLAWAALTPGIIRAGNNLSKLNQGIVWSRPEYTPWDKVSYDELCIYWGWQARSQRGARGLKPPIDPVSFITSH